jgi:ELWxxDGT repeat protein
VSRPALLALAIAAAGAAVATASPTHRVADVNPGPATAGSDNWWSHTQFVELGGRALFAADDGIHGVELWATDGTVAGTELVADICPGACWSLPREIVRAGGRVYFSADDGAHGEELWISDGTALGTRMVADLAPGRTGSHLIEIVPFGLGIAFQVRLDATGGELAISDGTPQGTTVLDLVPGPEGSGPVPWGELAGKLVFAASHPAHGHEVRITDGTLAGTLLLADTEPGPESGTIGYGNSDLVYPIVARLGDRILFAGGGGTGTGWALWVTDGTPGGTELIHPDIGFQPYGLVAFGDRVFFSGEDDDHGVEVWSTDGTPGGTGLFFDVYPGPEHSRPLDFTSIGDRLLFVARDDLHGGEPWITDGTPEGTALLADVNPGPASASPYRYLGFLPLAGGALLFADDGAHGMEPWFTDGTTAGTALLEDLFPGATPSFQLVLPFGIDDRTVVGGRALFRAASPGSGVELWSTDGTSSGTERIEINGQSSAVAIEVPFHVNALTGPRTIGAFGEGVLFRADDGVAGGEPWISDGSPGGTHRVADVNPGAAPSLPFGYLEAEHGAVFGANGGAEGCCGLWSTDGKAVDEIGGFAGDFLASARLGDLAIFNSYLDLIASDGTLPGTRWLATLSSYGAPLLTHDKWVYFGAQEPARTDGFVVEPLAEVRPGPDSSASYPLAAVGDRVMFAADDGIHGHELWALAADGSGAELLADIRPGADGGLPAEVGLLFLGDVPGAGAAGLAFFVADDGVHGQELWVSDGTPGNTVLLRDVVPGPRSSEIRWLTGAGERVFFVAEDGVHGREPWTSDGTLAGTRLVADLVPGPGSSLPTEPTVVDGLVYFSAHTVEHGRELWVSDGTAAGTRRLTDIAPGPMPSSPMALAASGGWLWFYATDGVSGRELWRFGLPGTIFADSFESGDTSAWTASAP